MEIEQIKVIIKPKSARMPVIGVSKKPIAVDTRMHLYPAQIKRCISQGALVYEESEDRSLRRILGFNGDETLYEEYDENPATLSLEDHPSSAIERYNRATVYAVNSGHRNDEDEGEKEQEESVEDVTEAVDAEFKGDDTVSEAIEENSADESESTDDELVEEVVTEDDSAEQKEEEHDHSNYNGERRQYKQNNYKKGNKR